MEAQNQTFSNSLQNIEKMQPYSIYEFTQYKEIQTRFARNAFIVYDEKTKAQYWANARLNSYIKSHLDNYEKYESGEYIINPPLSITTMDERTFIKFGMKIQYLDIHIEGPNAESHMLETKSNRHPYRSKKQV